MNVRTRDVTSTLAPGTPHSAPTNSPPCASAEPASSNTQAKPAITPVADLNRILPLRKRIVRAGEGITGTKGHQLAGGSALGPDRRSELNEHHYQRFVTVLLA